MSMHPWDYYNYTFSEFNLKKRGYESRKREEERQLRRQTYLILSGLASKIPSVYDLWPIYGDDELRKTQREAETQRLSNTLKRVRENKAIQRAIEKINGTNADTSRG